MIKALEMAMERNFQQQLQDTDVSAETSEPVSITTPIATRRADAIAEIAESYLNAEPSVSATADRYQVVVHVSAETLKEIGGQVPYLDAARRINPAGFSNLKSYPNQYDEIGYLSPYSCLDDGPHVSAETSRRIACDCSIIKLTEDKEGEILSIGRKTRAIPPSIRRALRFRDQGCRFPGCTNTHFVDGHHIQHWADGGDTSLDNLVQLCRHHHRLVHEGGYACERTADGAIEFRSPQGIKLAAYLPLSGVSKPSHLKQWVRRDNPTADITEMSCVSLWAGERMDWDIAVERLFG